MFGVFLTIKTDTFGNVYIIYPYLLKYIIFLYNLTHSLLFSAQYDNLLHAFTICLTLLRVIPFLLLFSLHHNSFLNTYSRFVHFIICSKICQLTLIVQLLNTDVEKIKADTKA